MRFHLVSERIVKDDILYLIHIEEFETMARDTKLGKEEITVTSPMLVKKPQKP